MDISKKLKSKKIIAIAVDCGFNGVKICVNGKLFVFPSYIFPITSKDELLMSNNSSDSIIYSERLSNRGTDSYVIGDMAKALINKYSAIGEYQEFILNLKTLNVFFGMEEAIFLIRASIAYSLVKYSEDNDIGFSLDNLDAFTIYLNLAFPHDLMHQAFGYLMGPLSVDTSINIDINGNMYSINLSIKQEHISCSSQVLAVFNELICDRNGAYSISMEELLNMLPAVVLDGGYRTQGVATISKDKSLLVEDVHSYEKYAMIEVNKETASIINDKAIDNGAVNYKPIMEYDIESNIRSKIDFIYDIKDSNNDGRKRLVEVKFNEIKEIRDNILEKNANEYCDFLIDTYKIGKSKTIIVAGGTGAAYFDIIKERISAYAGERINTVLLEDTYDGEVISPVFTIVIGAYKNLMNMLRHEIE